MKAWGGGQWAVGGVKGAWGGEDGAVGGAHVLQDGHIHAISAFRSQAPPAPPTAPYTPPRWCHNHERSPVREMSSTAPEQHNKTMLVSQHSSTATPRWCHNPKRSPVWEMSSTAPEQHPTQDSAQPAQHTHSAHGTEKVMALSTHLRPPDELRLQRRGQRRILRVLRHFRQQLLRRRLRVGGRKLKAARGGGQERAHGGGVAAARGEGRP